ncbi:MAG: MCE family protein [Candidatus Aureabacteria bacterium]|nr:MCE family protein [Candidatus Auribacterota bacterium]
MAEYYKNEVRTGLMVIICLALLIFLITSVGDFHFFEKPYEIKIIFSSVSKLEEDAPVTYAGDGIGKVTNIRILTPQEREKYCGLYDKKYNCEVTLQVNYGVHIEEDALPRIETMGFLGSKYINFSPGSQGQTFLKAGARIVGLESIEMGTLLEEVQVKLHTLGDKVEGLLDSSKQLVNDADSMLAENREDIRNTVQEIKSSAQNIKSITKKIDDDIGDIMDNTKIFTAKIADKPNSIVWGYKDKGDHPSVDRDLGRPGGSDRRVTPSRTSPRINDSEDESRNQGYLMGN